MTERLSLVAVTLGAVACGASAPSAADGDASLDSGREDASIGSPLEAGFDTGIHRDTSEPSPVTPVGRALAKVADAQLAGVTDDGYVAFIDSLGAIYVVDLTGGSPQLVVSATGGIVPTADAESDVERYSEVVVSHAFVAAWSSTVSSLASSPLIVWSAKLGSPRQVAASSMPGVFEAAADSSFYTYADAVVGGNASATLYGVLGDGTGAKALTSPIVFSNVSENCYPKQVLASPYLVVASCLAQGFGAPATPSVVSFDSSQGWAQATLVPSAIDQVAVDPSGDYVLAATSAGALQVLPIGGGAAVAVDEGNPVSTLPTSTRTLFLAQSPPRALYQTSSGGLKVATLAGADGGGGGTASTLATGTVGPIFGLSPDGAYVSYAGGVGDSVSGYPVDFSIISLTPGAAVVPLDRGNPGLVFSDLYDPDLFNGTEFGLGTSYPFTADSAYALLSTVSAGSLDDTPPGSLQAVPVTGGFQQTTPSTHAVFTAVPLTGSRVLYNDGYKSSGNIVGGPIADLHVVDLATNDPALILAGADADFVVSPDLGTVVYSLNYGTAVDGVYAVAIPK